MSVLGRDKRYALGHPPSPTSPIAQNEKEQPKGFQTVGSQEVQVFSAEIDQNQAGTTESVADKAVGNHDSAQEPPMRLFALVIAIDKYESNNIPHLAGCVNDGEDFTAFLTRTLHVPPHRIERLVNEQATRTAILDAFKRHLILNPEIQKGDPIVFFYAGHGDRVPAPECWFAEENKIETICPYDQRAILDYSKDKDSDLHLTDGIPDRTFDALMRRLALEKGDNITAIFDSCHSGGMARVDPDSSYKMRSLPYNVCRVCPPPTLDEDIRKWDNADRYAAMDIPTGFMYKGMHSHVLLAACRPNEQAKELFTSELSSAGTTRGIFTLHLLDILRAATPDPTYLQLSYARLMQKLSTQLESKPPLAQDQHPQCEGAHSDRALFSTRLVLDRSNSFGVQHAREHSAWIVEAGSIHGIVGGTCFGHPTIQDSSAPVEGLERTELVADKVEVENCTVRFNPEPGEIPAAALHGARVIVTHWNTHILPGVNIPDLRLGHRKPTSLCRVALPAEYSDIHLQSRGGRKWCVERFDPLTRRYAAKTVDIGEGDVLDALDHIIRFNSLLYRFHDSGTAIDECLKVTVHLNALAQLPTSRGLPVYGPRPFDFFAASANQPPPEPRSAYNVLRPIKEAKITDVSSWYALTLVNESDFDLYPYVFYFDPSNYAVHKWYAPYAPWGSAPLPRGGKLPIGYGASGTDAIRFDVPKGQDSDSGFLKVFVSTTSVDMRGVYHESITQGRPAKMVELPLKDQWNAWVYVLTASKPDLTS